MAANKVAGIGDEAVQARTGRTWRQWFTILDRAGARKMDHRHIATHLYRREGLSGWWSQMVTVGYEQARGLRQKHQKPTGFEISAAKTVRAPLAALYEAWANPKTRRRWLKDWKFEVRKATPRKSMRVTWVDRATHLDVNFYAKSKNKSMVSVQHSKLADAKQAGRMKRYWTGALNRLAGLLQA